MKKAGSSGRQGERSTTVAWRRHNSESFRGIIRRLARAISSMHSIGDSTNDRTESLKIESEEREKEGFKGKFDNTIY
jgi:hypothetical protein